MSDSEVSPIEPSLEIIVGIDMGVTSTGVAICAHNSTTIFGPSIIQEWPGVPEGEIVNRVPTQIAYDARIRTGIHSWGFECPKPEQIDHGITVVDNFKHWLDSRMLLENFQNKPDDAPSLEDVKIWYIDFLTALHNHIKQYIKSKWNVDFNETKIQYSFSIPVSWAHDLKIALAFKEVISRAGFENAIMELAESEAVVIFAAREYGITFSRDDVFIVCDAGEVTTDVCVLRVGNMAGNSFKLDNVIEPRAIHNGSINIDKTFEERAERFLRDVMEGDPELLKRIAHEIRQTKFQDVKTALGTPMSVPVWTFRVPNTNKEIVFSENELETIYDQQIQKIFELIDSQMAYLKGVMPGTRSARLVLAGDLCSSKYVQTKIRDHYDLEVLSTEEHDMKLAVCKGVVIDHLERLYGDIFTISPQFPNFEASYGIVCNELYRKGNLEDLQSRVKNPIDGKYYIGNRIDWLFNSGTFETGAVATKKFSRIVRPGTSNSWGFAVVESHAPPTIPPPRYFKDGQATVICYVYSPESTPSVARRWRTALRRFVKIEYELTATIEQGDISFKARVIEQDDTAQYDLEVQWLDEGPDKGVVVADRGPEHGLIRAAE
ncbi:hypothetical protein F5884DRAFT_339040 [Xylogone sp. PMI_703]|nr:hypothetical protein F5884DRAFT_339040 [Xylogone sp. PMI_703]